MIAKIPGEYGHVIPQTLIRCVQCSRQTIEIDHDDEEPLCSICRIADRYAAMGIAQAAAADAFREAMREGVHEIVIPIEQQRLAPPVFGTGSGEIDSCDLVLAMRHQRTVDRDSRLCSMLTWGFCVLEGLLLMGAAAMR